MIKLTTDIIGTTLTGCTWIEQWGGLVTPVTKFDEGLEQTFPVSNCMDASCFNSNKHNPLIPDSRFKSLVYLEQDGTVSHEYYGAKDSQSIWTGKLRLITFLNYQKLGIVDCNLDYLFIQELTDKLNVRKPTACVINGNDKAASLMITRVTELPKDANTIFGKYSYSKKMTNLLLYPYSYFGLSLDFKLTLNNSCFPSVESLVSCEPIECLSHEVEQKVEYQDQNKKIIRNK